MWGEAHYWFCCHLLKILEPLSPFHVAYLGDLRSQLTNGKVNVQSSCIFTFHVLAPLENYLKNWNNLRNVARRVNQINQSIKRNFYSMTCIRNKFVRFRLSSLTSD